MAKFGPHKMIRNSSGIPQVTTSNEEEPLLIIVYTKGTQCVKIPLQCERLEKVVPCTKQEAFSN